MRSLSLALAGVLMLCPAAAAQDISEEVDLFLWCGSAFHLLAMSVGNETEAALFLEAGEALTDRGAAELFEAGASEETIITLIAEYDERVIVDFESEADLPYAADTCFDAL